MLLFIVHIRRYEIWFDGARIKKIRINRSLNFNSLGVSVIKFIFN
jgi:hypothetical protein